MHCLRQLFWLSAMYSFHIKARYVPSKENVISDSLSRLDHFKNTETILHLMGYPKTTFINLQNNMSLQAFLFLQGRWQRNSVI